MAMTGIIQETELRKAIEQLHPDDELFEVRVIGSRNKKPITGYFKDADTLLDGLKTINLRGVNIYITLQQIDNSLFSRAQSEQFIAGAAATSDTEVNGYKWLFIDMDPVRASGISSSDEELKEAFELAKKISMYLSDCGFEEPVKAMSGNGAHLLYRIQLINNEENKILVEKCLKALSMMFDNDRVKVDTANFNQSRVCKLYGTLAQKGKSTKERPYRMSHIFGDVKECKVTNRAYLEKLAGELPEEPPKPSRINNYRPSDFDLEEWMDKYGLSYKKADYKDGVKYVLDECPFDSSHKAPDSMITRAANGAIGFKCLHNSCSGYRWKDLRLKYEPDAYDVSDDERRITEGYLRHNREKEAEIKAHQKEVARVKEPIFLNAQMIADMGEVVEEYVKTGVNVIDKRMKGLQKGCVSVISGLRGAAKSTFLSQIILNCIQNESTTVCYSGELSSQRFMRWMYLQAAGKAYTKPYHEYEGYYCPNEIKPYINTWMADYMWLYNNHHGNNFNEIGKYLRTEILKRKADMCIVDNLMALDLSTFDINKYEAQTKFVWELKDIAQSCNVHIIFVAHPRKAGGFLRLDDISGTGNIANIVDNAFIVHRNNEDFQRLSKEMFDWKADHKAYSGTNVIEICKDREGGIQDEFVPLWYEMETKRLKNYQAENVIYGWEPDELKRNGFDDADLNEIPF